MYISTSEVPHDAWICYFIPLHANIPLSILCLSTPSTFTFTRITLRNFVDIGEMTSFETTNSVFQSHYGPGVDSASNRNEYQDSPGGGVKIGLLVRLTTLPPSVS
jgi:hypothetical protein